MANPQSTAPVLILLVGTSGSHPLSPSIGSGDSVTTPAERGVTPWSVADVARTALAWEGSSGRPLTHSPPLSALQSERPAGRGRLIRMNVRGSDVSYR